MAPRKKLNKRDFDRVTKHLSMTPQVLDRVRAVLVDGERQVDVAGAAGVSVGSVSTAVNRVWRAYLDGLTMPTGLEEVTAVLTEDQAAIVRTWNKDNTNRRSEP